MRVLKVCFIAAVFSPYAALATSLAPVPVKAIDWQSCDKGQFSQWFGQEEVPDRLQCGYLEAPLSYDDDNTHETVRLAVTRLPATGEKQGSLVTVAGGPGLPGIRVPLVAETVNENFDIIGYDPRGVGQSRPGILCPSPQSDEGVDTLTAEKQNADWVQDCTINTGLKVLKHIGTDEAVNDLEVLRNALGNDKLNVIGYSYGTQVAQIYAERFPSKVRAMVLDGVVDITEDGITSDYKQALSFQQSFERFAGYCEKEQACQLNKTHATAVYHQLLKKVDALGLTDNNDEEIDSGDIILATTNTLYSSEDWPALAKLLRSIDSDSFDYPTLAKLEKTEEGEAAPEQNYRPRAQNRVQPGPLAHHKDGSDTKSQAEQEADNLLVIACADSANPDADIHQSRLLAQRQVEASGFSNYPTKTESPRNTCDFWPFKGKLHPHVPIVSPELPPLLFVEQLYDPATPYVGAAKMAKYFHSPLITVKGDGHTIALYDVNQCVDDEVVDYLLNPEVARDNKGC
ncbi:alpha/beta hydrolase [Serratia quinivorans]|uniref:alpha/beta hydrolase n=1 Tax=Serratia quinivorans TaxID=137545 RepID=UPI0039060A52